MPKANEKALEVVREIAIKEAVKIFGKTNPPAKFVSRLRQDTASSNSYISTWLSLGETALSQAGFPRCTFMWKSPITTLWNVTMTNVLVETWLQCHHAGKIPSAYVVDTSLDVAKWAHESLLRWVSNKRSVYGQEGKQKALVNAEGGAQVLVDKAKERREKASIKRMKTKVKCFRSLYINFLELLCWLSLIILV